MKKKNREALRTALNEFRDAYRIFLDDVKKDMVSKIEESDDEVKVYIGSESEIDDNVTVVKTKYNAGGREGTIAVIGPKRMEYERVVNMLEYLKENIEKKYNNDK